MDLNKIIECLRRIAVTLHERPQAALFELWEVSANVDDQIPYRDGHILRVTKHAVAIGWKMGLNEETMLTLETAALLHDYGKIGIDETILQKPGKLTPGERREVEMHVMKGYHILSGFPEFADALDGIKYHHEKYDGSGYPEGLDCENIPLIARIIAVADSYDAMSSKRPYRAAKMKTEAIAELKRCAGTEFDPEVVNVFIGILNGGK